MLPTLGISLGCHVSGYNWPQCLPILAHIGDFGRTSGLKVPHVASGPHSSLPDGHLSLLPSHTGKAHLEWSGSLLEPPAGLYQIPVLHFSGTAVLVSTVATILTAQYWAVYQIFLGLHPLPANLSTFIFGSPVWVPRWQVPSFLVFPAFLDGEY